ncbi:MAG: NAD(P)/FAD-dependent oxidoreductase [Candidatus Bathyarchaeia archaeon]
MEKADILVIGAGVVGLAVASELARRDRDLFIVEKEEKYGMGASSRNSEVIHAGIYYPKGSLKAELCVKGNRMLYNICRENRIPHKRLGKLIVATNEEEMKTIGDLYRQGRENGAEGLEMIDEDGIRRFEPEVKAIGAIYSPSTGILDAHALMDHFYRKARRNSGIDPLILGTEVIDVKPVRGGYRVEMLGMGERTSVEAEVVINSAGLNADRIAEMVGIDVDREGYRIHPCKGDYFSLSGRPPVRMLIYPEPPKGGAGLGIHATPDLTGRIKFGPNAYYVKEINYKVESEVEEFWRDITKYLPCIRKEDLHPDMAGVRAKLQGPGQPFRDFVIKHEEDKGLPGFIDLIGIESPGLTASPAIAEMVKNMVEEILE